MARKFECLLSLHVSSGDSQDTFYKEVTLPFVPFVGLTLNVGPEWCGVNTFDVEAVEFDCVSEKFILTENRFLSKKDMELNLESIGWVLQKDPNYVPVGVCR